jgi:hypothetical protein
MILGFLKKFKNHPLNQSTDTGALTNYIEKGKVYELKTWDVALINISKNETYTLYGDFKTGKIERSAPCEDDAVIISGKNHRVGQPSDEKIALSPEDVAAAKELAVNLKRMKLEEEGVSEEEIAEKLKKVTPIGNHYREFRKRPLLILYIVKVKNSEEFGSIAAYAISFPKINNSDLCNSSRKGLYKVNQRWWEEYIKPSWDELEEVADNEE